MVEVKACAAQIEQRELAVERHDALHTLREAARQLAKRQFDVVLFTSSIQLDHLLLIAEDLAIRDDVLAALRNHTAVASVGPIMTKALEDIGAELKANPGLLPNHYTGFVSKDNKYYAPIKDAALAMGWLAPVKK